MKGGLVQHEILGISSCALLFPMSPEDVTFNGILQDI